MARAYLRLQSSSRRRFTSRHQCSHFEPSGAPGLWLQGAQPSTSHLHMGNWASKGAQPPNLLMQRTFCGAPKSNPTQESLVMQVVNNPFSLGTIIFDAKNRAAP